MARSDFAARLEQLMAPWHALATHGVSRLRRTGRWLIRHRAALLAALALLTGWALLTWGVASLLVWQVWPISAGLMLVSLFGWRLFGLVALEGLYSLTRERRG